MAKQACDLCGDFPKDLHLQAKCHPTAPLRAIVHNDTGKLELRCYVPECNRKVATIQVALLWQPIETAPKDESFILGWWGLHWSYTITSIYWDLAKSAWMRSNDPEQYFPKLWQPLPQPPKETP